MKQMLSLFTLLFLFQHLSFSQNKNIVDSLETLLKTAKADSNKAIILYRLSLSYLGSDPDQAMDYARQTLALSEQIDFKKGIGFAYNSMVTIHGMKGDYLSALEFAKKALQLQQEIGYKMGISSSYLNIGNIFWYMGNYPEALSNYFASLKVAEEIEDKQSMGRSYSSIGMVYHTLRNYPEGLKNYISALALAEETGEKQAIAYYSGNIAEVYMEKGDYAEASKRFSTTFKICEEIGDKKGIGDTYVNIAIINKIQGDNPEALNNYKSALSIYEEIEDQQGIALVYNSIGRIYISQNNYTDASKNLNQGLAIAKQIGSLDDIKQSYEGLTALDSARGNSNMELQHYKLFITARDSMFNQENVKKIVQNQMQYDFDKKEAATKAEQDIKDAVAIKELQKQKLVRNGFIGGFAFVLMFAGVFFIQRNKIKKGKKKSDELLLNILPSEVAEELKAKGSADAKQFDEVTVMFTDFKGFTQISEKLSPAELVAEIDACFKAFDNIITKHNIEKIKTIGDAYMCAGGLPVANKSHADDVVSAALEIQKFMLGHLQQRKNEGKEPFEIRIGIHTGPVVAGIVGVKKFAYDIWGDTVNIASRMESSGEAGKVNISGSTYELVKDKFKCEHRGKIQAKNKGEIDMYFVSRSLSEG